MFRLFLSRNVFHNKILNIEYQILNIKGSENSDVLLTKSD
jgi:hypothetical protein